MCCQDEKSKERVAVFHVGRLRRPKLARTIKHSIFQGGDLRMDNMRCGSTCSNSRPVGLHQQCLSQRKIEGVGGWAECVLGGTVRTCKRVVMNSPINSNSLPFRYSQDSCAVVLIRVHQSDDIDRDIPRHLSHEVEDDLSDGDVATSSKPSVTARPESKIC